MEAQLIWNADGSLVWVTLGKEKSIALATLHELMHGLRLYVINKKMSEVMAQTLIKQAEERATLPLDSKTTLVSISLITVSLMPNVTLRASHVNIYSTSSWEEIFSPERPELKICKSCGRHGELWLATGVFLVRSKAHFTAILPELVRAGHIRRTEAKEILREVLESTIDA